MRMRKRISGMLLSLCLVSFTALPVQAAQKEERYDYRVRFLAGAQGVFHSGGNLSNNGTQSPHLEGSECLVFDGLKEGQRVSFHNGMITLKDSGKYYVKGIRESGRDNNTVYYSAFTVEGDRDYVVAYGILGDAVAYTINYEDTAGNRLAPSETFYGNVGDRPVVSYLYIEGYQPQAYNLIGRLGENAANNIFTFVYSRVRTGGTGSGTTGTGTSGTTTTVIGGGTSAGTGSTVQGGTAGGGTTVTGGTAGGGGAAGGAGADGVDAAGTDDADETEEGALDGEAEAADEEGTEPQEIVQVDDEALPLSNGDEVVDSGVKAPADFAKLLAIPLSAKVGIFSTLVLIGGSVIRFFVLGRRKKEEDE